MFKVLGITASYGDQALFADATFTVAGNDRVGLVGPNGVGKSTLLRIIAGELAATAGYVEFAPGTRIGYFAGQVPDTDDTVAGFLDAAPGELAELHRLIRDLRPGYEHELERYTQLGGWAYEARIAEVRDRLGITALADDAPLGTLSGGEQARLMLARVLLDEPTVLLLDEPTNHLDAAGIAWLGTYLAGFAGAIVVVTHDRALLDRVAGRIVEIDGIHDEPQYYTGGYTDYRAEKRARWQRWLLEFEAQEKARARLAEDIERTKNQSLGVELSTRNDQIRRYAKKVAAKAIARERRLNRQMLATTWIAEPQRRAPLVLAFPDATDAVGTTVLRARDVTLPYGRIEGRFDLDVRAGDRILLTGANGTGKSTLLRTLAGQIPPASGEVTGDGVVALLPQTHDDLRLAVSVREFFRSRVPVYVDEAQELLRAYLFDDVQQRQPLADAVRRGNPAAAAGDDREQSGQRDPARRADELSRLRCARRGRGGTLRVPGRFDCGDARRVPSGGDRLRPASGHQRRSAGRSRR